MDQDHPNTSCEKQPQPQGLEKGTPSNIQPVQVAPREAEETQNPRIVPAMDFCHGAQPCRADRAAAAALLTPTPSWGYSFSAAFLFQRWFSYHRSLARSRNICGGQKEVKRFQLQLGSSDTSFQIKASLFALAHPTSRAAHNFLELCLSQEQFVANDLL